MLEETGCDAVMIGRGALGNPWLIKECVDYLENGVEPKEVTVDEKIEMILKHLSYLLEIKPEKVAILELRSHAAWYLKGIPHTAQVRQKLMQATTKEDVKAILDEFRKGI